MYLKTLYFFSLLFTIGFVSARSDGITPDEIKKWYPYAVVDMKEIDFGQVESGKPVTAKVSISNEGSYDLLIAKARSSCGLMIQTWPSAPVKPGDSVLLNFRFDSNRLGPFARLITIHTNAWNKDLTIEVKGEIVPVAIK
jgi:hypothetical protein